MNLFFLTVIVYGFFQYENLKQNYYSIELRNEAYLKKIESNMERVNEKMISMYLLKDSEDQETIKKEIKEIIEDSNDIIEQTFGETKEKEEMVKKWIQYQELIQKEFGKKQSDKKFAFYVNYIKSEQKKIQRSINVEREKIVTKNKKHYEKMKQKKKISNILLVVYLVSTVSFMVITPKWVHRTLIIPIQTFILELSKRTSGNLKIGVNVTRNDEIGSLQRSLKILIIKLKKIIEETKMVSDNIYKIYEKIALHQENMSSLSQIIQENLGLNERLTQTLQNNTYQNETFVHRYSDEISHVFHSSSLILQQTEGVRKETNKRLNDIREPKEKNKNLEENIENYQRKIKTLEKHFREIEDTVKTMMNLSGKLNMLAIHSKIEASVISKNEFSYISNDIEKLNIETIQYLNDFQTLYMNANESILESNHKTKNAKIKIEENKKSILETEAIFNKIIKDIGSINDNLLMENEISKEQQEIKENLVLNFNKVKMVTEKNLQTGKEMTDLIVKQIHDIKSLTDITNRLLTSSLHLEEKLKRFEI